MSGFELPADIQADQEQRIQALEAQVRELKAKLEIAEEALTGAQNIVRELRDRDSDLPSATHCNARRIAPWPGDAVPLQY